MMSRFSLAIVALFFSTQLFGGTLSPSEDDVERWIYHYYQHPMIDLVPDAVTYFSQRREMTPDDHEFMVGFLAGVFRKNPAKVSWILDKLKDLPDTKFDSVIQGLWLANLPDSKNLVVALVRTRRESNIEVNRLQAPPATTRAFIFTGAACGMYSATGESEVGPNCWQDNSKLPALETNNYVIYHRIFATRNSFYVKQLLEIPADQTNKYAYIYQSLRLLNLDTESKYIGNYSERIRLQRSLGLPLSTVKTVGDAVTLAERDPKGLDELRRMEFQKTISIRFGTEAEIPEHFASQNLKWQSENDRYHYRGNAIWEHGNRKDYTAAIMIQNKRTTPIARYSRASLQLQIDKSGKPIELACYFLDGDIDPGKSAIVTCNDPGTNHPNGIRSSLSELTDAITFMTRNHLPLALLEEGRADDNQEFDRDSKNADLALEEIKKTTCLQRGSCTEAIAKVSKN